MEKYINQGPLTLERQLASYQEASPIYKHLWATWETAKDDLASILKNIILIFPHYSLHDASHAETIIRRVEAILGEERIKKLKPTEVWLFLMSAYTHDLGMLVSHEKILKIWKKPEFKDYLNSLASKDCDLKEFADLVLKRDNLEDDWPIKVSWAACVLTADYIRKYHAGQSNEIIHTPEVARTLFTFDFSFQKFIHERLINLLGRIAMLHGSDFSDILALPYRCQGMGLSDDLVYPRRLAAMLRLGDLLDMDNGRFDHNVIHINGVVPETTRFHQEKEASLRHFLVTENCIEATFDCPNEGSYEAATSWMNLLKQETEDLALHWGKIVSDNFGTAPVLQSSSIYLNRELLEGNVLKKFDFSNDSIFELMEGANIYKNKFSCLRELVQNAEDASKLQLWEDLQRGEFPRLCSESIKNLKPFDITNDIREKYKISITFKHNTSDDTYDVQITDHGIGITKERVAQMGKVANSWHNLEQNKERYANMPVWLKPTGAFGIGLQSVFRVTDILECTTVPHNEEAQKIIFRSRKKGGHISSQKLPKECVRPYGTTFSFRIEANAFSSISYALGGIFEQKLSDFDPFKHGEVDDRKTLNLYYLLECLCNDVKSAFFPIEVKIKNGQSEEIIPFAASSPVAIDQENKLDSSNGRIEISFNWETGEVLAYNAQRCITYRLTLAAQLHYGNIAFTFKGMAVNFKAFGNILERPYMCSVQGKIHLDGFPTKDWLTLNREEIRSEKIDELQKILEEDIITILSWIYHKISTNSAGSNPVEKLPLESIVALLLLSGIIIEKNSSVDLITMSDIGHIRNTLLERLKGAANDDVCYLLFEHGGLLEDALGWKDFFETMWEGQKFFVYDIEGYGLQNSLLPMTTEKLKEKISKIISDQIKSNEENEKNKNEDDPGSEYFFSWDQIKRCIVTDFIKILKIYGNNNEYIYECRIEESKTRNIPEVSKSIQSYINKEILVPNRRVTFAMKAYEDLAVTDVPLLLANARRNEFLGRFSDVFDTFMITPFTNVDKKDIEENDGETCWEHIQGRDDFNSLVQFVREHNVNQSVSGEDIREAYHRWILDIIDARE